MKDDRYTTAQIRAGQIALEDFIRDLEDRDMLPPPYTPSGHPLGYMNAGNMLAMVILRRNGGWVGDIVFKNVPKGFPEVTGTPDSKPFANEQDALFAAQSIVYQLLQSPKPVEDVACMAFPELGGRRPLVIGNHIIGVGYRA